MKEFKFFQRVITYPPDIIKFFDRISYNEGWVCKMEQNVGNFNHGNPYKKGNRSYIMWVRGYEDCNN